VLRLLLAREAGEVVIDAAPVLVGGGGRRPLRMHVLEHVGVRTHQRPRRTPRAAIHSLSAAACTRHDVSSKLLRSRHSSRFSISGVHVAAAPPCDAAAALRGTFSRRRDAARNALPPAIRTRALLTS
jgi:hypothetical protein